MGADDMATQGTGESTTLIFTVLNRINSVPARQGLIDTKILTHTETHWFYITVQNKYHK